MVTPARPPASAPSPEALHDFVESHAAPSHLGQLARWEAPICASTAGLDDKRGAVIVAGIDGLARRVGAPVAAAGCHPNLAVVVSERPQAVLDYVKRRLPVLLGYHYNAQIKRISTVRYPIQAWYVTGTRGSVGGLIVDDSCCPSPSGRAGSRFSADMVSELGAVVVVVDAGVLANHALGEIGDYIAVLALSEADLSHPCGPLPSILDDLADCAASRAEPGPSGADVAFLKGLYSTDPRVFGWMQRASIADAMRRSIEDRRRRSRRRPGGDLTWQGPLSISARSLVRPFQDAPEDESPQLPQVAQDAPSRLQARAPQGPHLHHQQDRPAL
jgi:hypothetical protein